MKSVMLLEMTFEVGEHTLDGITEKVRVALAGEGIEVEDVTEMVVALDAKMLEVTRVNEANCLEVAAMKAGLAMDEGEEG